MELVIFVHPEFINSQSMPRYARMLFDGMRSRGHNVEMWTSKSFFSKIPAPDIIKKWLGYLDQFFLFPFWVKIKLLKCSSKTLFIFADQALGPWMPLVSKRPFIVHCHDFMAQKSALGKTPENKVPITGKFYQKLIRKGFQNCRHFISISNKTKIDLHKFLKTEPEISRVVYNGLNQNFQPGNYREIRKSLSKQFSLHLDPGFLLHVGGNQFYKNRKGVILIYNAWREISATELPLLLIGSEPTKELKIVRETSEYSSSIFFLSRISDDALRAFYQGASLFLFPSLAEGFGWPIAEAMASGCPVITTGESPMTEVGGPHTKYIPRMPMGQNNMNTWARQAASLVETIVTMPENEKNEQIQKGLNHIKKFDPDKSLDDIETIYKEVYQMC